MIVKHIRYILVLVCLACSMSHVSAQKYKDIYPSIAEANDEDVLPILKNYLRIDIDHPAANLKLALIYDRRYKDADLLTEYDKAIANAERAKLMFIKSSQLVDDRDVRKNPGYYSEFSQGIDSKNNPIVDYSVVSSAMVNKNDSISVFLDKAPPIYQSFIKAVKTYDKAIKIFADVNNQYSSLDELFMMYNDQLNNQLKELKQAYDSTIVYLDQYKALIADFPIKGYNQEYRVQNIDTYRLSGLITQSDFLSNTILLWNYGEWVDDVNEVMSTDISSLRSQIINYEKELNDGLKKSSDPSLYSDFEPISRNKELLFKLKKYDSRSLLVGVFQYKDYLQQLRHRALGELYYDTAKLVSVETKYAYYSELINGYYLGDSMINVAQVRLSQESVAKHQEFVDQYYQGYSGMNNFVETEQKSVKSSFDKSVLTLRNTIVEQLNKDASLPISEARYKRLKIPVDINDTTMIDSLIIGAMMTTHRIKSADGSYYLSGAYRKPDKIKNTVAYVLRLTNNNSVSWYKEYDIAIDSASSDANNWVAGLTINPEGCAMIIRSSHLQNATFANTLVYINELGEEKLIKRLEKNNYPRSINYSESTNSFVFSLKGDHVQQDEKLEQELNVINVNVLGDQLWQYTTSFAGTVEKIVNIQNGYMIAGNFTIKKDNQGSMVRTKVSENQTNAYLEVISKSGVLNSTLLIKSPKSFFIKEVVKVNDGSINLLGMIGEYEVHRNDKLDYGKNLVHIIANSKLQMIHNSLN